MSYWHQLWTSAGKFRFGRVKELDRNFICFEAWATDSARETHARKEYASDLYTVKSLFGIFGLAFSDAFPLGDGREFVYLTIHLLIRHFD